MRLLLVSAGVAFVLIAIGHLLRRGARSNRRRAWKESEYS